MALINNSPKAKIHRGFSTVNRDFGNWKVSDLDLIKQDLMNHFAIRKGEKLENADFGSVTQDLTHEPLDDRLRQALTDDINQVLDAEPRVTVQNVDMVSYDHGIEVRIEVLFDGFDISEAIILKFDKDNGIR